MLEIFNRGHWARNWFIEKGANAETASWLTFALDVILLILICLIIDFIARRLILGVVKRYVKKSSNPYDDIFLERKVFQALAHLVPAIVFWRALPVLVGDLNISISWLRILITIAMIVLVMMVVVRFLRALRDIGQKMPRFQDKPVGSYVQVAMLTAYILAGIFILSLLIGKSPLTILAGFGAATAVLLLVFKDTILGLVASIQISANDMVRIGDWVTMDKYGADGNVLEITLTTVMVRNFDKTITTVPTYAFISDSFRNWRGMQAMGIRRIKRALYIDLGSIQFVDDAMRDRFLKFQRVKDFVIQRQQEIDKFNAENEVDTSEMINGRRMTNVGVFRRYAIEFIKSRPKIAEDPAVMVRQLEPTDQGLPLEVVAFSTDIEWANFEGIQADIFDHLLAAADRFGLRIYQSPSGTDVRFLKASPPAPLQEERGDAVENGDGK